MAVNFEYYKVFYYVAEYQNITRAAEKLCLSQPSVTKCIQNLEAQLQCRLFSRSKCGTKLTAEGQVLFDRIRPACGSFFEAENELERRRQMEAGNVRICADFFTLRPFLPTLQAYRKAYPHIALDIQSHPEGIPLAELESGRFDVLLCLAPADALLPPGVKAGAAHAGIQVETLRTLREIPLAGKELAHLAERKLQLDELLEHTILFRSEDTRPGGFYHELLTRKRASRDPSYIMTNSLTMQLSMTQANLGISFMPPEYVQEEIANHSLFPLRVAERLPERRFLLIAPPSRQLSFAAQQFLAFLSDAAHSGR